MDNNSWSRRTNNGKLSLATSISSAAKESKPIESPRTFTPSKRFGGDTSSHGKSNPFNSMAPGSSGLVSSPSVGGSSAFGLGSGAFASFGSKAPKTPATEASNVPVTESEVRKAPELVGKETTAMGSATSGNWHPLTYRWVIWYRPVTPKNADYEASIQKVRSFDTAEAFWAVYRKLNRPSTLPIVSDYHIFREGIRPVWEDEENKRGGKFIMRLKKGVADRYWEELLMALVGHQFGEASDEVTGAVLSIRNGEDVLSVWTKLDGGRNIRIRETIRRLLNLPSDTNLVFKSHDASIAQRTALDEARREKATGNGPHLKRRDTFSEDSGLEKTKG